MAASTVAQLGDEFSLELIANLHLEGKVEGTDVFALPGTKQARTEGQLANAG